MEFKSKELAIRLLLLIRFLMPVAMAILLFVLPSVSYREYFRQSLAIDLGVRAFLFLYISFGYWAITTNMEKRIKNATPLIYQMTRHIFSLISMIVGGIIFCAFFWLLSWWPLSTFVPFLPKLVVDIIALTNGVLFGALFVSQYFLLPEDE